MAKVICWDCGGSGKKEYYTHIDGGICYTCYGKGVWNERTLTEMQQQRKDIAQAKRDKFRLIELDKELKAINTQLMPLAMNFANYTLTTQQPPKEERAQLDACLAKIKAVSIEGYHLQKKVSDITYVKFRDAYLVYDELRGAK